MSDIFMPHPDTTLRFLDDHNGHGTEKFARWLVGGLIDESDASRCLNDAVEDALISVFAQRRHTSTDGTLQLPLEEEHLIRDAVALRLPSLEPEQKAAMVDLLMKELRQHLDDCGLMRLEGGWICLSEDRLTVVYDEVARQ